MRRDTLAESDVDLLLSSLAKTARSLGGRPAQLRATALSKVRSGGGQGCFLTA